MDSVIPGKAQAQTQATCNTSPTPPPAAPVTADYANQSFGSAFPSRPYFEVSTLGADGCPGAPNGGYDTNGNPGQPGQAGGQISTTDTNNTIFGGHRFASGTGTHGGEIVSYGGAGGAGSPAGTPVFRDTFSGDGGVGGAAGSVTVRFNAAFVADAAGLADVGLNVLSPGAAGGRGADASDGFGGFNHTAGNGGAGGAGGTVTTDASGSVRANDVGVVGRSVGGNGGSGGNGDTFDLVSHIIGRTGGNGGAGGPVTLGWSNGTIQSARLGLIGSSTGGRGGDGGLAVKYNRVLDADGGDGGGGGNGGTTSVVLAAGGAITTNLLPGGTRASAVAATSNGGDGGNGGEANGSNPRAGRGGNGGNGGAAGVGVLGTVTFNGSNTQGLPSGQAILVQSNGGAGGGGGNADSGIGQAGGGGFAGAGGGVTLSLGSANVAAAVSTSGNFAHGALVQSIGGGGGDGGTGTGFFTAGGAGAAGGNGGPIQVHAPDASVIMTGSNSIALLAQSIGGGGGSGGDDRTVAAGIFVVAIGGNGGAGGDGGPVGIDLERGVFGSTRASPLGGGGILAQSIGGSGGSGGNAIVLSSALYAMAIGGDAKGGGVGGAVNVTNQALVTTYGDHAAGIQAQSIGGGGGKGGNAVVFNATVAVPSVSVSVGGRGGSGGAAGNVTVTNSTGQIATYGADAPGVLIQSIGGGGGTGGSAAARSVSLGPPDPPIPAISISVAMGGAGGDGNTAGTVRLDNSGLITTAGDFSIGVMAQSIGGGGGTGGDSTAASYAKGAQDNVSISVSVAVGGSGGTGATGGAVEIRNTGVIATMGQDAYGVFAQSVGGGGGAGGGGDATATAGSAKSGFSASLTIGGSGGTGGHAGTASLTNAGSVTTRGDGATAIFVQSVGGGGGAGGGGVSTANGGEISVAVGVGGRGGAGGNGNTTTVSNSGSIVTRGTDAIGMSVQSIGGGGGTAGKAGATAGGSPGIANAQALFDLVSNGLGLGHGKATEIADGIFRIGEFGQRIEASATELEELFGQFGQPQAPDPGDPNNPERTKAPKINIGVTVGGRGGAAGNGGAANATNNGLIATYGAQSDGIYAQSVGGGGGSGGAATSTGTSANDASAQTAIGVGGGGGGGGSGGPVTVVNGTNGVINTHGISAIGIFAQSVGGGGGEGAAAGTVSGSLKSLSIGIGGSGGTGGDGGAVSVTAGDGTPNSYVSTSGKNSIAIVAQSVGGGGGLARTMTTDQTFDPSKIASNPQGRIGDVQGFSLNLGGSAGATGSGGNVQVTTLGTVTTQGRNAHGILAQSIGGGGGLVIGGQLNSSTSGTSGASGASGASGNGGAVRIELQTNSSIVTAGDGAYGVLAQSIGGGGGVAGDLSTILQYGLGVGPAVKPNAGNGDSVSVTASNATIQTNGAFAPAIFAQSIGGGGGLIGYNFVGGSKINGLAFGTAGGEGNGGSVTVSLTNSRVIATGIGSTGIFAQSIGRTSGSIEINIDRQSLVQGGQPDPHSGLGAAIQIWDGTANQINNAGIIRGDASTNGGVAILSNTPFNTGTKVDNSGQIVGNLVYTGGGRGLVDNLPGGLIDASTTINLGGGVLRNAGTLLVGGSGTAGRTTLTGDLVQEPSGRLIVDTNHGTGVSDQLLVQGRAALSGTVDVHAATVANRAVSVLTATDGLTVDPGLSTTRTHLFRFDARQAGNSLQIQPAAEFQLAATSLGDNQRRVAAHLQELWDSGAKIDAAFTALAGIGEGAGYGRALNSLSGQTVGAIAAFRYSSSHNFIANMLGDCTTYEGAGRSQDEAGCAWGRAFGSHSRQDSTGGALGYQANAWTLQAGGQRQIAPGWFVGGSVAYESSEFRGDAGTSRVTGDSMLLGATLRYQGGPWQLSGALDFGYGWYRSKRDISVGSFGATASASPMAWHAGAHTRIAYQVPFEGWYLQPRLDLHLTYVRSSGYTETGAGPFNLAVEAEGGTSFAAVPAVEVGGRIRLSDTTVLRPYASAGIQATANPDWTTTTRFAGQPASRGFRATTPVPGVLGKFTVGAELLSSANWDFRLQYSTEVGDGYVSHTGVGRLAYQF